MASPILITVSVLLSLLTIKVDFCKCELAKAAFHYSSNGDEMIEADGGLWQYIGAPQLYVPFCPPCPQQQPQKIPPCMQDMPGDMGHNQQTSAKQQQQQPQEQKQQAPQEQKQQEAQEQKQQEPQVQEQPQEQKQQQPQEQKEQQQQPQEQKQQQQQHYQIDQTSDDHKNKHNVHYRFAYDVNNRKTGDVKYHKEERHGDVVRGEYALLEGDANVRTVKYYADWKNGFHAQVINSKRRNLG